MESPALFSVVGEALPPGMMPARTSRVRRAASRNRTAAAGPAAGEEIHTTP